MRDSCGSCGAIRQPQWEACPFCKFKYLRPPTGSGPAAPGQQGFNGNSAADEPVVIRTGMSSGAKWAIGGGVAVVFLLLLGVTGWMVATKGDDGPPELAFVPTTTSTTVPIATTTTMVIEAYQNEAIPFCSTGAGSISNAVPFDPAVEPEIVWAPLTDAAAPAARKLSTAAVAPGLVGCLSMVPTDKVIRNCDYPDNVRVSHLSVEWTASLHTAVSGELVTETSGVTSNASCAEKVTGQPDSKLTEIAWTNAVLDDWINDVATAVWPRRACATGANNTFPNAVTLGGLPTVAATWIDSPLEMVELPNIMQPTVSTPASAALCLDWGHRGVGLDCKLSVSGIYVFADGRTEEPITVRSRDCDFLGPVPEIDSDFVSDHFSEVLGY